MNETTCDHARTLPSGLGPNVRMCLDCGEWVLTIEEPINVVVDRPRREFVIKDVPAEPAEPSKK